MAKTFYGENEIDAFSDSDQLPAECRVQRLRCELFDLREEKDS